MTEQEAKNRVVVMVTATLCLFLLISLVGAYALAWTGKDAGEIWPKIFDLISVLTGALVGYLAGTQVEKARLSNELQESVSKEIGVGFTPTSPDTEDEGA